MSQNKQTLVFPSTLRQKADDGDAYVSFVLLKAGDADTGKSVNMYLPPGFATSDSMNYNGISTASARLLESSRVGTIEEQDVVNKVVRETASRGGTLGDVLAAQEIENRRALNPFTSVAFEGTNVRQFEFTFNMVPESAEESEEINRIVNFFRKFMYPDTTDSGITLKYPPLFQIFFYVNGEESEYMPKISEEGTYLTSLNTTINQTSNSFHANGAPVETQIALSFQETAAFVRSDLYPNGGNE